MSVDCAEILSAGKTILASATSEAELRASIGCSYYSAYHHAKAFHATLESPGSVTTKSGGMHETLCLQFQNPTILSGPIRSKSVQIGHMCKALLRSRIKSDYWIDEDIPQFDAQNSCDIAKQLLAL
jgi:hypothetical protein